jgi:phospholipase D1/2
MPKSSKKLSAGDKARLVAPIVLYAVIALVAWKLGYFHAEKVSAAAEKSSGQIWFGGAFVAVYTLLTALAMPISPLAYAAGAVFGFWRASMLVWVASIFGAVAGYYLAHGILAKPARTLLGRYKDKLRNLGRGNAFVTALRMQLMPIVPFGAFNYAAAISKLEVLEFLAGTAIGIIPGTLLATFIGDRFAAGVHGKSKTPYLFAAAAALVVLALSFAPKLWDKIRTSRKHR